MWRVLQLRYNLPCFANPVICFSGWRPVSAAPHRSDNDRLPFQNHAISHRGGNFCRAWNSHIEREPIDDSVHGDRYVDLSATPVPPNLLRWSGFHNYSLGCAGIRAPTPTSQFPGPRMARSANNLEPQIQSPRQSTVKPSSRMSRALACTSMNNRGESGKKTRLPEYVHHRSHSSVPYCEKGTLVRQLVADSTRCTALTQARVAL